MLAYSCCSTGYADISGNIIIILLYSGLLLPLEIVAEYLLLRYMNVYNTSSAPSSQFNRLSTTLLSSTQSFPPSWLWPSIAKSHLFIYEVERVQNYYSEEMFHSTTSQYPNCFGSRILQLMCFIKDINIEVELTQICCPITISNNLIHNIV